MLEALLRKAGNTEPGFTRKSVKWAISCASDGRYTGVIPLLEGENEFSYCPTLSQPELVAGGEMRSHFLAESLSTVALYWKGGIESKEMDKSRMKHTYFCNLLENASLAVPFLSGAAKMLANENTLATICLDLKQQKAKPTELATIMIDSIIPLQQSEWHGWWRQFRNSLKKPNSSDTIPKMRCIATGELVEPILVHAKITGLASVGGLGTGDVLVGFDKEAFRSYGLQQAANAAMSEETATAYAETLNDLIRKTGVKLGKTLTTYWFLETISDEYDPLPWLIEPTEQTQAAAELKARDLLKAIREGKRPDLAGNRYMMLMLSGAAGRVMVREMAEGSFESLVAAIDQWFSHLSIVNRTGKETTRRPRFFSIVNAIEFLSKDGRILRNIDDVPSALIRGLWRSAITGSQIPSSAMSRTLMRVRSDIVSDAIPMETRFSILKSYLLRKGDDNMKPYLNPEHPHAAYHCGRLLAVFARLQRSALGDVGAGVVQRYYTAASQTPGLILGRLASNAKNHLGKLEGGLPFWYEDQIAEIMGRIKDTVPRTLTLEEQSLFALGYYQQIASLNAGKGETQEDISNPNSIQKEEN